MASIPPIPSGEGEVYEKVRTFITGCIIAHAEYSEFSQETIYTSANLVLFDAFISDNDKKTLYAYKTSDHAVAMSFIFPNSYRYGIHCFIKTAPFTSELRYGFENLIYFMMHDDLISETSYIFNNILLPNMISSETLASKTGLSIANAFTTFAGSLNILSNTPTPNKGGAGSIIGRQPQTIKLIIPRILTEINNVTYSEYKDVFSKRVGNKKLVQIWEHNLFNYAENILKIWYAQILSFVKNGFLFKSETQNQSGQQPNNPGFASSGNFIQTNGGQGGAQAPTGKDGQQATPSGKNIGQDSFGAGSGGGGSGSMKKQVKKVNQIQRIVYDDNEYNYWNILFQKNKGPTTFEIPSIFSDSASKLKRSKIDALYERLLSNTEEKKTTTQNTNNIVNLFHENMYDTGTFPNFDSPYAKVTPLVPTDYRSMFNVNEHNKVINAKEVEACFMNTLSNIKGKYAAFTPNIPKEYLTELLNMREGSFLMYYYSWVRRNEILYDLNEQISLPQAQTLIKLLEYKKSSLLVHFSKLIRLFNDVLLEAREINCVMGTVLPCILKMHTIVSMDQQKQATNLQKTSKMTGNDINSGFVRSISNSTYFTVYNILGMALSNTKKFGSQRFGDVIKCVFRDIIFACQRYIGPDRLFFHSPDMYLENITQVNERLENIRKCFMQIKKEKFMDVANSFDEKYIYHTINPFMSRLRQIKSFLEFYIDFLPMSKSLSTDFMSDFSRSIISKIDNLRPDSDSSKLTYSLLSIVTIPPQVIQNRTKQQAIEYKNIMISYNFDKIYNEFIDFFSEKEKQIANYIFYEIKTAGIDQPSIDKFLNNPKLHGIKFFFRWDLSRVFELFFSLRSLLNRKSVYESISNMMKSLLICYTKSCTKMIQKNAPQGQFTLHTIAERGFPGNYDRVARGLFFNMEKYARYIEMVNILIYRISAPIKLLTSLNFFSELEELNDAVEIHNSIMEMLIEIRLNLFKKYKTVNIDVCKRVLSNDVYGLLKMIASMELDRVEIEESVKGITKARRKIAKIIEYYYSSYFILNLMKYKITKNDFLESIEQAKEAQARSTGGHEEETGMTAAENNNNLESDYNEYIGMSDKRDIDMKDIYSGMMTKSNINFVYKVPDYVMMRIKFPHFKFVKPSVMNMNRIMFPGLFNPVLSFTIPPDLEMIHKYASRFDILVHAKLLKNTFDTISQLFNDPGIRLVVNDMYMAISSSLNNIEIDPNKIIELKEKGDEELHRMESRIRSAGEQSRRGMSGVSSDADTTKHDGLNVLTEVNERHDPNHDSPGMHTQLKETMKSSSGHTQPENDEGTGKGRLKTESDHSTNGNMGNDGEDGDTPAHHDDSGEGDTAGHTSIMKSEEGTASEKELVHDPLFEFMSSTQDSFRSSYMIIKPFVKRLDISFKFLASIRFKVQNQILDLVNVIPIFRHKTPIDLISPFIVGENGDRLEELPNLVDFTYIKTDDIPRTTKNTTSTEHQEQRWTLDFINPEMRKTFGEVIKSVMLVGPDTIFTPFKKILSRTKFTTYFEVLEAMKQSFVKAMNNLNQLSNTYHIILIQSYQMMNLPPTSPAFNHLLSGFISIFYTGIIQIITIYLIIIYYMTDKETDPMFHIEFIGNENDFLFFFPSLGSNDISAIAFENININGLNCPLVQNQIQNDCEEITLHQTFLEIYSNILSLSYYPEIMYERIMKMYRNKDDSSQRMQDNQGGDGESNNNGNNDSNNDASSTNKGPDDGDKRARGNETPSDTHMMKSGSKSNYASTASLPTLGSQQGNVNIGEYDFGLTHTIQQLSKYFGSFARKNWFLRDCQGVFGNIVLKTMENIEEALNTATTCVNEFTKLNIEFTKPDFHVQYDIEETNPTKITNNIRMAENELLKIEKIAFSTKQYVEVINRIDRNSNVFDCGMFNVYPKNAALYTKKKCMIKIYESLHPFIEVIESTISYVSTLIKRQIVILKILDMIFKANGMGDPDAVEEMEEQSNRGGSDEGSGSDKVNSKEIIISDKYMKKLEKYESTNLVKLIEYESVITNITPTVVVILLAMITDKLFRCYYNTYCTIERILMPILIMTKETNITINDATLSAIKQIPLIWKMIDPMLLTLRAIIPTHEKIIISWFDGAVKNLDKKLIAFYYSIINESDMLLNSDQNESRTDYIELISAFEHTLDSNNEKLKTYEKISEIFDTFTFSTNIPVKSVSFKILHFLLDSLYTLLPIFKEATTKIEEFKTKRIGEINHDYFKSIRLYSRDNAKKIAQLFNFKESGAMFQSGKSMRDLQNHMKVKYLKYKFMTENEKKGAAPNNLFKQVDEGKDATKDEGEIYANEVYPLTKFEMRKLIYKSVLLKFIKRQLKHIFGITDIINLTQNFKYKHWFSITNKIVYLIDDQTLMQKIQPTADNPEYSEKKLYASLIIDLKLNKYLNVVYDMYTQILKTNAKNDENSIIHKYWAAVSEESLLPSFVEIIDIMYCFMVRCPEFDILKLFIDGTNFTMPTPFLNNNNFFHNINNHIRSLKLFISEENVNLTTTYNIQQFNIWLWKLPLVFIELSSIMNYLLRVKTYYCPRTTKLKNEKQLIIDCLELCYILLTEIQSRISWNHNQVSVIWSQVVLSAEIYQRIVLISSRSKGKDAASNTALKNQDDKSGRQRIIDLYMQSKTPANYLYEVFEKDNNDLAANQVHVFDINEAAVFLLDFILIIKSIFMVQISAENEAWLKVYPINKNDFSKITNSIYRTITEPMRHPVDISINLDVMISVINYLYDMENQIDMASAHFSDPIPAANVGNSENPDGIATNFSKETEKVIEDISEGEHKASKASSEKDDGGAPTGANEKSHEGSQNSNHNEEDTEEGEKLNGNEEEEDFVSSTRSYSDRMSDEQSQQTSGNEGDIPMFDVDKLRFNTVNDWGNMINTQSILKDKLPTFSNILNRFNLKSYFNKTINSPNVSSLNSILMVNESYIMINRVVSSIFTDYIYNINSNIIAVDTIYGEAVPFILQTNVRERLPLTTSADLPRNIDMINRDFLFPAISVYSLLVVRILRQSYNLEHISGTLISSPSVSGMHDNIVFNNSNFRKLLPISFLLTQHGIISNYEPDANRDNSTGFFVKDISTRPLISIIVGLFAYINSYIVFGRGDPIETSTGKDSGGRAAPYAKSKVSQSTNESSTRTENSSDKKYKLSNAPSSRQRSTVDDRIKRAFRIIDEIKQMFIVLGQRFIMIKNSIYFPLPIGFLPYSKSKLAAICYVLDWMKDRIDKLSMKNIQNINLDRYLILNPLGMVILPKCEVDIFGCKFYQTPEHKKGFEKLNQKCCFVVFDKTGGVVMQPYAAETAVISFIKKNGGMMKMYTSQFAVFEDYNNKYASTVYSVFPRSKVILSDTNTLKYASKLSEVLIQYLYADEFIFTSNEEFKNSIQAAMENNGESADVSSMNSTANTGSVSGVQTSAGGGDDKNTNDEIKYIMSDHENQFKWYEELIQTYGSNWLAGSMLSLPDVIIAVSAKYSQFHCPQPLPPLQILRTVYTEEEAIKAHSGYAFSYSQSQQATNSLGTTTKKTTDLQAMTQRDQVGGSGANAEGTKFEGDKGRNDMNSLTGHGSSKNTLLTLTLEQVTSSNLLYFSRFKSVVLFEDLLKMPVISFCVRGMNPKLKKISDCNLFQKFPSIQKALITHFDMIYLTLNPITLTPLNLKNVKKKIQKKKNGFESSVGASVEGTSRTNDSSESSNFTSDVSIHSDMSSSHDMSASDNGTAMSSSMGLSLSGAGPQSDMNPSTMSDMTSSTTESTDAYGRSRQSLVASGFGDSSGKTKSRNNKYTFIQKNIESLFGGDFESNSAVKSIIEYWSSCIIKIDMYLKFNDFIVINAPQGFGTEVILQAFYDMCEAMGISIRSSRTRGKFMNYNNMVEPALTPINFSSAHMNNFQNESKKDKSNIKKADGAPLGFSGCGNGFLFGADQEILNANIGMMESRILSRGGLVKKYESYINVSYIYSEKEIYDSKNAVAGTLSSQIVVPNPNILSFSHFPEKNIIVTDIPDVYNKLFSQETKDAMQLRPPQITISDPDPEIVILLTLSQWKNREVVDNHQDINGNEDGESSKSYHEVNGHTLNDRYNLKTGSLFQSATQAGRDFIFPLLLRPLCIITRITLSFLKDQNTIYTIVDQMIKLLTAYFDAIIIGMNPITLRLINTEQVNTIILYSFFWTLIGYYPLKELFVDQNTKARAMGIGSGSTQPQEVSVQGQAQGSNINSILAGSGNSANNNAANGAVKIKSSWDGVWDKLGENDSTSNQTTDRSTRADSIFNQGKQEPSMGVINSVHVSQRAADSARQASGGEPSSYDYDYGSGSLGGSEDTDFGPENHPFDELHDNLNIPKLQTENYFGQGSGSSYDVFLVPFANLKNRIMTAVKSLCPINDSPLGFLPVLIDTKNRIAMSLEPWENIAGLMFGYSTKDKQNINQNDGDQTAKSAIGGIQANNNFGSSGAGQEAAGENGGKDISFMPEILIDISPMIFNSILFMHERNNLVFTATETSPEIGPLIFEHLLRIFSSKYNENLLKQYSGNTIERVLRYSPEMHLVYAALFIVPNSEFQAFELGDAVGNSVSYSLYNPKSIARNSRSLEEEYLHYYTTKNYCETTHYDYLANEFGKLFEPIPISQANDLSEKNRAIGNKIQNAGSDDGTSSEKSDCTSINNVYGMPICSHVTPGTIYHIDYIGEFYDACINEGFDGKSTKTTDLALYYDTSFLNMINNNYVPLKDGYYIPNMSVTHFVVLPSALSNSHYIRKHSVITKKTVLMPPLLPSETGIEDVYAEYYLDGVLDEIESQNMIVFNDNMDVPMDADDDEEGDENQALNVNEENSDDYKNFISITVNMVTDCIEECMESINKGIALSTNTTRRARSSQELSVYYSRGLFGKKEFYFILYKIKMYFNTIDHNVNEVGVKNDAMAGNSANFTANPGLNSLFDAYGAINTNNVTYLLCMSIYTAFKMLLMHPDVSASFRNELLMTTIPKILINRLMINIFSSAGVVDTNIASGSSKIINSESMVETENAKIFTNYVMTFEKSIELSTGITSTHHKVIQDPYKNVLFDLGNSLKTVRAIKNHAMSGESDKGLGSSVTSEISPSDKAGSDPKAKGIDKSAGKTGDAGKSFGSKKSGNDGVLAKGLVAVGVCNTIFGAGIDENDTVETNSKTKGAGLKESLAKFYTSVSCVIKPFKSIVEDWYVENTPGSFKFEDGSFDSRQGGGGASAGDSEKARTSTNATRNDFTTNSDYVATSVIQSMISVVIQNRIFGSHVIYNSNNSELGSTLGNSDNPAFLARTTLSLYSSTSFVCVSNANVPILQILQKTVQAITDFNPFVIEFRPLLKCDRETESRFKGFSTSRSDSSIKHADSENQCQVSKKATFLFISENFNVYRVVEYILKHVLDVYLFVAQTGKQGIVYINQNSFNLQFKSHRDALKFQHLLMEIVEDLVKTSYSNKLMYIMNEEQKNRFRTFLLISPLMKIFLNSNGSGSGGGGRDGDNSMNSNNKNVINNDTNIAWLLAYSGILSHITFVVHIYDTTDNVTVAIDDSTQTKPPAETQKDQKMNILMNGRELSLVSTWIDFNPSFWKSSYIFSFDDTMDVNDLYSYLETKKYLMADDFSDVAILLRDDGDKMSNTEVIVGNADNQATSRTGDTGGKSKDRKGQKKGSSDKGKDGHEAASMSMASGSHHTVNSRTNKARQTQVITTVLDKVFNAIPYRIDSYKMKIQKFDPRSFINLNDLIQKMTSDLSKAYIVPPESIRLNPDISFLANSNVDSNIYLRRDDKNNILSRVGVSTKNFTFKKYIILSKLNLNVSKLNGIIYLLCQNFSVISISHVIQSIISLPICGSAAQKDNTVKLFDMRPSMYTPYTIFFRVFLRKTLLTIVDLEHSKLLFTKMDEILKEMESSKVKYNSLLIQINNNNNVLQRTLIGICHDTMQLKETKSQIAATEKEKDKITTKINEIQARRRSDFLILDAMVKWMNDNKESIKTAFTKVVEKSQLRESDMVVIAFSKVIIYAATGKVFDLSLANLGGSITASKSTTLRGIGGRADGISATAKGRKEDNGPLSPGLSSELLEQISGETKQVFSVFSSVLRKTDLMISKISSFMGLGGDDMATKIETAESIYNDFVYVIKKLASGRSEGDRSIYTLVSIISPLLIIDEAKMQDNTKFAEYLDTNVVRLHPDFVSAISRSVFNIEDNKPIVYLCAFILHKIFMDKESIASNSNLSKLIKQQKTLEETIANFVSMTEESEKRIEEESQTYQEIEDRVRIMKEKVHKKKRNMGLDDVEDDGSGGSDIIDGMNNINDASGLGDNNNKNNSNYGAGGRDNGREGAKSLTANKQFFTKLSDLSAEYKQRYNITMSSSSTMLQDCLFALIVTLELPYLMYNLQTEAKNTNKDNVKTLFFKEIETITETCGLHLSPIFKRFLKDGLIRTETTESIIRNSLLDFSSVNVGSFRSLTGSDFLDELVDVFVLVHGFVDYSIVNAVSIRLLSTLSINKSPCYIVDDDDAENIMQNQFGVVKPLEEIAPGEMMTIPIISLVRSIEFLTCRRNKKYTVELNDFDYDIFPPEPDPIILSPEFCIKNLETAQIEIFTECAQRLLATQKAFLKALAVLEGVGVAVGNDKSKKAEEHGADGEEEEEEVNDEFVAEEEEQEAKEGDDDKSKEKKEDETTKVEGENTKAAGSGKKTTNALSIDGTINLVIPGSKSDTVYFYPLTIVMGEPIPFEIVKPFATSGGEYIKEYGNKTEIITETDSSTKYAVDYDITYNYSRKATNYKEAIIKTFMPCSTSFICTDSIYREMVKNSLFRESTVPIRISSHHQRLTGPQQVIYSKQRVRREVLAHVLDVITNCDKTITSNKEFKNLLSNL